MTTIAADGSRTELQAGGWEHFASGSKARKKRPR